MVTGFLGQLHDGTPRSQSQAGHVWFAATHTRRNVSQTSNYEHKTFLLCRSNFTKILLAKKKVANSLVIPNTTLYLRWYPILQNNSLELNPMLATFKHADPDYLARAMDLFSLRWSNEK